MRKTIFFSFLEILKGKPKKLNKSLVFHTSVHWYVGNRVCVYVGNFNILLFLFFASFYYLIFHTQNFLFLLFFLWEEIFLLFLFCSSCCCFFLFIFCLIFTDSDFKNRFSDFTIQFFVLFSIFLSIFFSHIIFYFIFFILAWDANITNNQM